jgi:hypothetical protein
MIINWSKDVVILVAIQIIEVLYMNAVRTTDEQ